MQFNLFGFQSWKISYFETLGLTTFVAFPNFESCGITKFRVVILRNTPSLIVIENKDIQHFVDVYVYSNSNFIGKEAYVPDVPQF